MHRNRYADRNETSSHRRNVFRPVTDEFEARVLLSDIPVLNTNDAGQGSLRDALSHALSNDRIVFQIPVAGNNYDAATGSWTIVLNSPLPAISTPAITIDGLTQQSQPGAATTHPVVEITPGPRNTGNGLHDVFRREHHSGPGDRRLPGQRRARRRLRRDGQPGDRELHRHGRHGHDGLPNQLAGVRLGGSSNTVSSNLISGNTSEGVFVTGGGDQVLDNRIGTDAAGTTALGNGFSGITISQTANVLVRGNTISGNGVSQAGAAGSSSARRAPT